MASGGSDELKAGHVWPGAARGGASDKVVHAWVSAQSAESATRLPFMYSTVAPAAASADLEAR